MAQAGKSAPKVHTSFGVVRAVNSGDSVSIFENSRQAIPPIREITLSHLQAPRLGHGETPEKPWAWESREFLRKLAIGQKVSFTIEHKAQNREYGVVTLNDSNINLAEAVAEAGWAEVRAPPDGKPPRAGLHASLIALQERAKELKIGIFQTDADGIRAAPPKFSTMEIFEKYKNQKISGFIDYVRDANAVSVILPENGLKFLLKIAGAEAPSIPPKSKLAESPVPPFAEEARFFVERHLLHRDVQILISAPGEAGRQEYFGSIYLGGVTLTDQLIRNGYAKLIEWNAPRDLLESFQRLQLQAQQQKVRIWKNYNPAAAAPGNVKNIHGTWLGKVREIREASWLVIEKLDDNSLHQIFLSNVNTPRLRGKEGTQPYAHEARESIRGRVIGKKVEVKFDYERNNVEYFSVYLETKSLALMLVEKGFAKVVSFEGCNRTDAYQQLTIAENRARDKGKHVWNKNPSSAPVHHVTDTTLRSNEAEKKASKQKAKQFLPSLQRAGRTSALVEHVYSGSRFKLTVPKESVVIFFSLEALRSPGYSARAEEASEPFGKESYDFAHERIFQRNVEIIVTNVDKGGNFIGTLFYNQQNFGSVLLENGLAKVNHSALELSNYPNEYRKAETLAKNAKLRIWKDYSEEAARSAEEEVSNEKAPVLLSVVVSEIADPPLFYLQFTEDLPRLQKMMADLNARDHPVIPSFAPKRNTLAVTKFAGDNQWYRVRVLKYDNATKQAEVQYFDYGNSETVPLASLRPLSTEFDLEHYPVFAKTAQLAFVDPPSAEYREEAAEFFHSLVWEKTLFASLEHTVTGTYFVRLGDGQQLVNVQMVEAGYGTVVTSQASDPRKQALVKLLNEKQAEARSSRLGMWEYGDNVYDDDDY